MSHIRFCPDCGSPLQPQHQFCTQCGHAIPLRCVKPQESPMSSPPQASATFPPPAPRKILKVTEAEATEMVSALIFTASALLPFTSQDGTLVSPGSEDFQQIHLLWTLVDKILYAFPGIKNHTWLGFTEYQKVARAPPDHRGQERALRLLYQSWCSYGWNRGRPRRGGIRSDETP